MLRILSKRHEGQRGSGAQGPEVRGRVRPKRYGGAARLKGTRTSPAEAPRRTGKAQGDRDEGGGRDEVNGEELLVDKVEDDVDVEDADAAGALVDEVELQGVGVEELFGDDVEEEVEAVT